MLPLHVSSARPDTSRVTSYPTRRRQRLEGFDYSTSGSYAVTLCVRDRLPLFGRIVLSHMHRSPAGEEMEATWREIPSRHSGVELDTVMVMPDHLHGVLALNDESQSLSEVVHWFRSQSTARYARGVRVQGWKPFAGKLWQRGFYDRIMRTDDDREEMRAYVLTNPERWELWREEQQVRQGGPPHPQRVPRLRLTRGSAGRPLRTVRP